MQLFTLLKVIDLLSDPGGITKTDLAEKLGVSERHIYRIFSSIENLGFPLTEIQNDSEKRKRWKLLKSYILKLPNINVPDLQLNLSEIISLYLLRGEGRLYRGTDIEKNINSAFFKIGSILPDNTASQIKKIKSLFVPSSKFSKDYSGKEEIIEMITDAMLKRLSCSVKYNSFYDQTVKDLEIDPLHFFERDGGLYCFVRQSTSGDIVTLAVERIEELSVTDKTFEYPQGFTPEDLLESSFDITIEPPIEFKIWFSANQTRYIKQRIWSKTQKLEDQEDGSVILSMTTSGMRDVKRWVLSYGADAKVLEPEDLRKEIIEDIDKTKTLYR